MAQGLALRLSFAGSRRALGPWRILGPAARGYARGLRHRSAAGRDPHIQVMWCSKPCQGSNPAPRSQTDWGRRFGRSAPLAVTLVAGMAPGSSWGAFALGFLVLQIRRRPAPAGARPGFDPDRHLLQLEEGRGRTLSRSSPLFERLVKPAGLTMGDFAYLINTAEDSFYQEGIVPFMPEMGRCWARILFQAPLLEPAAQRDRPLPDQSRYRRDRAALLRIRRAPGRPATCSPTSPS
jgi:hypothetical protein